MNEDLLLELGRQALIDLARSSLAGTSPSEPVQGLKRGRLPRSLIAPEGEDMYARLCGIRRHVTPKEYAALRHLHVETIYRRINAGMPADREVDGNGRGRRLKIYPPQAAAWERECREAQKRLRQSKRAAQADSPGREISKPKQGKGNSE